MLALIIDPSTSYISYVRDKIFEKWGVDASSINTSIKRVGLPDLFGDILPSVINLPDVNSIKQFNKGFEDFKKLVENVPVIVTTSVSRKSTRKLEANFRSLGAEIVVPGKTPTKDLVNQLSVKPAVKQFMADYVGDDYEVLIPLVDSISQLPVSYQKRISIEDVYVRFPQPEGSVSPFEIEKPLFSGDVSGTVSMFRRIAHHTNYLVILSIIKNKFQNAYRVAVLLQSGVSEGEAQDVCGLNKGSFYYAKRTADRYGVKVLGGVLGRIVEVESLVKGGSAADPVLLMELLLVDLAKRLGG